MTSSSRIIRGDRVRQDVAAWRAPAVEDALPASREPPPLDPEAVREQARIEGFEQGRAEGIEAGRKELLPHAELLQRMLTALARPAQTLEHQFEDELLALIQAICRQLLRRELKHDPSHVVSIIREGLNALPVATTGIQVRLNQHDAETVRDLLRPEEGGRTWSIESDPLMERGGCQIVSETAQVDERLETRLARVVAAMLEDERDQRDAGPADDPGGERDGHDEHD